MPRFPAASRTANIPCADDIPRPGNGVMEHALESHDIPEDNDINIFRITTYIYLNIAMPQLDTIDDEI